MLFIYRHFAGKKKKIEIGLHKDKNLLGRNDASN